MTDPPIFPSFFFYAVFQSIPEQSPLREPPDATTRQDSWRDVPVTVFRRVNSGIDELGTRESTEEVWLDPVAGRYERLYYFSDTEVLGSAITTVEVVERSIVSADSALFAVDGLYLIHDPAEISTSGEPGVPTTSIVPTATPLMSDAVEITRDDIPTTALRTAVDLQPGDQLFLVPGSDAPLVVRLRALARPHLFAVDCSVLISVDLPVGWDGTCLERTLNGERVTGSFSYAEALDEP